MSELFFAVAAIVFVGALWGLYCNSRTYKDRTTVREWVFADNPHWAERLRVFDSVDYYAHLWDRFFLRNPWHRYGADGPPLPDSEEGGRT